MDSELVNKVAAWWNSMSGYDKNFYVKYYEGGSVPIASLTKGAIIRLYLKAIERLTPIQAMEKYRTLSHSSIQTSC